MCGDILRGVKTPSECKLFKKICNPEHPVGACMVSSEGLVQLIINMVNKNLTITLAHGSGGKLTHELVRKLFLPSFNNNALSL